MVSGDARRRATAAREPGDRDMPETKISTLATHVTDMHALINYGLRVIDRQAEQLRRRNQQSEALAAVHEFQRVLRAHLTQLGARAGALGGKTTLPLKDLVTTLTGVAAGLIGALRPEAASRAIRDDYTFLSHAAIGYLMLHATASGLGDGMTAALAEQGYRDVARLVMHIDQILPALVLQELRKDGLPVGPLSEQSRMMIRRAWDRESALSNLGSEHTARGPAA
jgi:hypothetical protein